MIKLINILKEITVYKPNKPLSTMYKDVKSIIADYVNRYGIGIQKSNPNRLNNDIFIEDKFLNELENGDLMNNLAYDLAKYDGFIGEFDDLIDDSNDNINDYYNRLAMTFLLKFGLENELLKLPFRDDYEKWLGYIYNNGDIFNNQFIKQYDKYRLRRI